MILREDEKQTVLEVIQKMGDFFWGPTFEQCENMLQVPFWLPMEKLLPWLDSPSIQVFNKIKTTLNHFSTAQALFDGLGEEFVRLFISDRQGIRAPLYASCYAAAEPGERAPLMGEPALDMKERFESQGLSLAEDIGEPPDHLSIQLEYLYFLLNRGWTEQDHKLIEEASAFAGKTMLSWVKRLEMDLAGGETAGLFYPPLATLLVSLLRFIGTLAAKP